MLRRHLSTRHRRNRSMPAAAQLQDRSVDTLAGKEHFSKAAINCQVTKSHPSRYLFREVKPLDPSVGSNW